MDPLSLTGTLIAIVQVSAKVISSCYEYQSVIRHASTEIDRILQEIGDLRNMMERLLQTATKGSNKMENLQDIAKPGHALQSCLHDLEYLQHELKDPLKRYKKRLRPLVWPLQEKQVSKVLSSIGRAREAVMLAISADNV